jgi:RNA polymerase sigma-70 factor (ECF subfamily)
MAETDQQALERALAGDRDGFRVLVERYSRPLFRLAFRMTDSETDADEVVQETFLRAWRGLERYDGRASFSTWIYRIAANCALDQLRGRRRRGEVLAMDDRLPLESGAPSPDRLVFDRQIKESLDLALAGLTVQERTAFVLRHHEDLSIDEISALLGLSREAAKHSVFRAVQKLRRALQPLVGTA